MITIGLSLVYRRTIEGPLAKLGIIKGLAMTSLAAEYTANERGSISMVILPWAASR